MCEHCKHKDAQIEKLIAHISGLRDAMYMGTNEPWETSESFVIGGPQGSYMCNSPFLGKVQWKLEVASCGSSNAQILVSSSPHSIIASPDYTGVQPGLNFNSFEGIAVAIPSNGCVPVDGDWYDVIPSHNAVFVIVTTPANAAFASIKFRQKRIVKV